MQKPKFCPNLSLPIKKHARSSSKKLSQTKTFSICIDRLIHTDNFIHTGLNGKPTKQPVNLALMQHKWKTHLNLPIRTTTGNISNTLILCGILSISISVPILDPILLAKMCLCIKHFSEY